MPYRDHSRDRRKLNEGVCRYDRLLDKLATDLWRQRELRYIDNNRDIRQLAQLGIQIRIGNSLLLLAVICTAVFFTRRFILSPINGLATAASAVATGDLEQTIAITSKDQTGHLHAAFNRMVHDLRNQHTGLIERAQTPRVSREQLRDFAVSLDAKIEDERGRIAHALRDELGQNLSVMRMYLSGLQRQATNGPRMTDTVARIEKIVGDSGKDMRRFNPTFHVLLMVSGSHEPAWSS
jgi:nitrate/nitrite-specific signal transduction histidine kinase